MCVCVWLGQLYSYLYEFQLYILATLLNFHLKYWNLSLKEKDYNQGFSASLFFGGGGGFGGEEEY